MYTVDSLFLQRDYPLWNLTSEVMVVAFKLLALDLNPLRFPGL